jgi:LPXTG-motif cell wall-anchored protein
MSSRLALLALILVAALSIAAAPVWAQSAGDEQYDDPFAGQDDQGQSAQPAPTATPAPAAAPATAAPTAAPPAATASAAQLPRTGTDTLFTAIAGLGLVLAGVGLRLRVPADGG